MKSLRERLFMQYQDGSWSPITLKNSVLQWIGAFLYSALWCWFVMGYHAWWRGKPCSLQTFDEGMACAAYYAMATAFTLGPLYRFGLCLKSWVSLRRPLGIVAGIFAAVHILMTFTTQWRNYGWNYICVEHWDMALLGVLSTALLAWLIKTAYPSAMEQNGLERWRKIQVCGLALLPLALAHFVVLGKIPKWMDWFRGVDKHAAPAGTLVVFIFGVVVIVLRIVDFICHVKDRTESEK